MAALVLVTATNRHGSIFPECWKQIRDTKCLSLMAYTSCTYYLCKFCLILSNPSNFLHKWKWICLLTTPFSQMTDILSSTPLTPLGILRKSSLPKAFWSALNVQLSVPVTCKSLLKLEDQFYSIWQGGLGLKIYLLAQDLQVSHNWN